jgi:hypothetical protein
MPRLPHRSSAFSRTACDKFSRKLSCFSRAQQVKELANVAKVVLVRSQRKMTIYFSRAKKSIIAIARQIETVGALLSVRKVMIIVVVVILNKEKLGHRTIFGMLAFGC